jgi:hypothetical protein
MSSLTEILKPLMCDGRISTVHVCVFLALLQLKEQSKRKGVFFVRRERVMRLAKMKGKTTYYRVMGDLDKWGYIEYWPSFKAGSKVWIR